MFKLPKTAKIGGYKGYKNAHNLPMDNILRSVNEKPSFQHIVSFRQRTVV